MNRDAILATVIGFILGLLITTIILFGPKVFQSLANIKFDTSKLSFLSKTNISPTPSEKIIENKSISNEPLVIDAPLSETISDTEQVLVSGTAIPGSYVIIAGAVDEIGIYVAKDGKFGGKVTLNEGINTIMVSAYNNQTVVQKTVIIYYSIDKLQ
jgi:hypothetical protein